MSQALTGLHSTSPGWYTSALEPKPTSASENILPQTAQYTEAKGSLRSSGRRSSHVPPSVPWHRTDFRSARESFSLSFRHTILPAVTQDLCDYRSFKHKFAAVILAALQTQRWFTGWGSHPTDLSTRGRPNQTRVPCFAILGPRRTSACRHLVAPSSPQERTTRPPGSLCSPSCLEHMAPVTTDLHLPPVSRIQLSW